MLKFSIYIDGSCNPNPKGLIGWGFVVCNGNGNNPKLIIHEDWGSLRPHEHNSNNVAEYLACYYALEWLENNFDYANDITILSDSKLLISQIKGIWDIKEGRYKPLAEVVIRKIKNLELNNKQFVWIPRELNKYADKLSNKII